MLSHSQFHEMTEKIAFGDVYPKSKTHLKPWHIIQIYIISFSCHSHAFKSKNISLVSFTLFRSDLDGKSTVFATKLPETVFATKLGFS